MKRELTRRIAFVLMLLSVLCAWAQTSSISVSGSVVTATGAQSPPLVCYVTPVSAGSHSIYTHCAIGTNKLMTSVLFVELNGGGSLSYNSSAGDSFTVLLSLDPVTKAVNWQVAINQVSQSGHF